MLKRKKKTTLSESELKQQKREQTAQQWIPIADIDNNVIYRKDNRLVGILRVQPENLDLLSDNEKRRKVEALAEGFNGETEGFQIFCIGRPVDLNNYLEWLQDKAKMEQDFMRKRVLKGYIEQASQLATSGETTERRFYIIIDKEVEKKAEIELITRLKDLQSKLLQAELTSHVCSDDEIMDVLSLFANPVQASFERPEVRYDIPTIMER
jgi:type IV secretory pathway VirB4 component